LHYIANEREDPFWKQMAALKQSDSLQFKIDHFKENGIISLDARELFGKPSWLAVMVGQGLLPKRAPGLSASADSRNIPIAERMKQVKQAIQEATQTMPRHSDAIQAIMSQA